MKHLKKTRGVMNLLTKEECENVLSENKIYLKNQMLKKERISHSVYLLNTATSLLERLIHEHFDNPALRFEEIKKGMWIWDNARKEWVKVEAQRETYTKIVECWVIGWVLLKTYEFEPNRFYRKEVRE